MKVSVDCKITGVDLYNGNILLKIGETEFKCCYKEQGNIDIIIEDMIKTIAENSFIHEENSRNLRILELKENTNYTKHGVVTDVINGIMHNKVVLCNNRGIGKSTFIHKMNEVFGLPIVYRYGFKSDPYDNSHDVYFIDSPVLQKVLPKGQTVLVDEVSIKDVDKLRGMGFNVVGFIGMQRFY